MMASWFSRRRLFLVEPFFQSRRDTYVGMKSVVGHTISQHAYQPLHEGRRPRAEVIRYRVPTKRAGAPTSYGLLASYPARQ
jgi:hypothetical protein